MQPNLPNRRGFLKAAAGLALLGSAAARSDTSGGYLIGCYTRPWDRWELGVALDAIAEAGYRWAGLMTAKGRTPEVLTPDTSVAEAARIGEEVRQRDLKVCSVYGAFSVRASLKEGIGQLERLIANAAACGSPELLLGGTTDPELHDAYYEAVRACCDQALSRKVGLTLKPHGGTNATGLQCRQAIQKVSHRNFRLWYDPGNILYYSDGQRSPLRDVLEVDGLVVGMSVKDFRPPKDVLITPGTGEVPWPALFARLRLGGFTRGQLLVECTAPGDLPQVTSHARQARLFVENLVRGQRFDSLQPEAGGGNP